MDTTIENVRAPRSYGEAIGTSLATGFLAATAAITATTAFGLSLIAFATISTAIIPWIAVIGAGICAFVTLALAKGAKEFFENEKAVGLNALRQMARPVGMVAPLAAVGTTLQLLS